jgi:hypothetical protein
MRAYQRWIGLTLCMASGLVGCKHQQTVEAELRYQNRRVRELENKLCQKQAEVYTLQTMAGSCETSPDGLKDTPDTIYRREAMSKVGLGLTTGPRDLDHNGCDDAVQYSIVCYDYDGDVFKCPGSAQLELVAIGESGVPVTVSTWQIAPDRLRETWRSSIVGSGYQIVLPAPTLQDSKKWQAVVRFSTLDGRVFQSSKDFALSKPKGPPMKSAPPAVLHELPTEPSELAPPPAEPLPVTTPPLETRKESVTPAPAEPSTRELTPPEPAPMGEPAPLPPPTPAITPDVPATKPDVPAPPVIPNLEAPALPPAGDPLPEISPPTPEITPEVPATKPIVPSPPRQTTYLAPLLSQSSSIDPMVKRVSATMPRTVRFLRPVVVKE